MHSFKSFIVDLISFLSIELSVIITSMLPVMELRFAIPFGISLGLSPLHAMIISFLGSLIPVPFILFGIRPVFNFLKHTKTFEKLVHHLTHKTLDKTSDKVQRYGAWALILFVAIPLPGTGVWTGSLAAALLDIRFKWAFPAIVFGNAIAAVVIVLLSHGFMQLI